MDASRRAPSSFKRCPACGSRVAVEESACELCGHQFGETSAIPLAEIEAARAREIERIQGTPSDAAARPATSTTRTTRTTAPKSRQAQPAARIPWGVLSVILLTALVLGGGYLGLRRFLSDAPAAATPTPAAGIAANATPTPAFQLAELAPPTVSPTSFIAPTRTPIPPKKYTVAAGDTCGGIAKALDVPYSAFLDANQLNDDACSRLQIGDTLLIPAATPTPGPTETLSPDYTPPPPEPAADGTGAGPYIVQQGDSCSGIAAKFKITIDDLIRLNTDLNLNQQCLIRAGDKLNVSGFIIATAPPATPYLILAPTARADYPAPQMLSPVDNATISDTMLLLEWLSVGLLRADETYVVQIQPAGAITVPVFETRGTSLRLSNDLLGSEPERPIAWWVQVRQRIGEQNGVPVYREISPPSPARRFVWRRGEPPATATPPMP